MSEKLWNKVARNFINAGIVLISVNDTILEILRTLITEEQAKLLQIFRKRSLNIDINKKKLSIKSYILNMLIN